MVLHLPRKRERLPHEARTPLPQRTEETLDVCRQPHLLSSRRVPTLGNDGLVNRQQVGATFARSRYSGGSDSRRQRAVNSLRSPATMATTCRVRLSNATHPHPLHLLFPAAELAGHFSPCP